ncbi:hypothetical protein ASPVEDRAFT_85120 [Aspergillus versicolor CBS 583.65]|uniref:DUF3984 domain-containing protein n=1 Tax=Aspergillus versicolor CBS 583.65 TaxID=1036611 RepID=A0A1L9PQA7_ASPVE|nr:uncharacterized protein ASPVEDRAFT_85120 [Aspergillus versicolor CBS 583.65]OJJ03683.1 hypothetical protein ASPVEDRAFT_85120 [Aspergillus versicolor CBS 583.65]
MDSSASPTQPGSRSRRSYPSLNQVSLAPLTPHYPIDGDNDTDQHPQDYFSPRNEALDTPTRTSYLSSFSVPGTPGVLSHAPSRSASRVRHHTRSKSSTPIHLSDTNIQERVANQPLHHHSRSTGSGSASVTSRTKRPAAHRHQSSDMRDPEWMLRAGVALASSAREEKGQSWLVKRESSTSLVSESGKYEADAISQALRKGMARSARSGRSTPAAASSRSRAVSRRNSRPDLAMTGLEMTMPSPPSKRSSGQAFSAPRTPSHTTNNEGRSSISLPDFIDEQVRAEMRDTIQQQAARDYDSTLSYDSWDSENDEEEEEIDERELQRLTRERGFGLGSWIDRMVEWTLFGVDDWPLSSTTDPITNPPPATAAELNENDHTAAESSDNDDEVKSLASDTISEIVPTERAGNRGGWEDAGWLFRAIKQALVSA